MVKMYNIKFLIQTISKLTASPVKYTLGAVKYSSILKSRNAIIGK